MKRIISLLIVLAMVFSLGVTVFAEQTEQQGPGKITISNATKGHEYAAYRVFEAVPGINGSVGYKITNDDAAFPFYKHLFDPNGNPWQPTAENPLDDAATGKLENGRYVNNFFTYNKDSKDVNKAEGVNDTDLINHLSKIIDSDSSLVPVRSATADGKTVLFDDIPTGYYVITSSLNTAITVNSAAPDVTVIDKNQKPGEHFDKLVQTGVKTDGTPEWGTVNSANIGDKVTYQIQMSATNYNGDALVKTYQIHDTKGDALWAEFNSFRIYYMTENSDKKVYLPKGYYLYQGPVVDGVETLNTGDWEFLGKHEDASGNLIDSWTDAEKQASGAINNADWYLVHTSQDTFRITIPWLREHKLKETSPYVYSLTYDTEESAYPSPITLYVEYDAVIEYNADNGGGASTNLHNKANGSWTDFDIHTTTQKDVETIVYGLGIYKDDSATHASLAGAEFSIYTDAGCTKPLYVVPTNIAGIYVADSLGRDIGDVSDGYEDVREIYKDYIKDDPLRAGDKQSNVVISPINGKIIVEGLEVGTYYLKETNAPLGYNAYSGTITMKVDEGMTPFYIYMDSTGAVQDVNINDGSYTRVDYNVVNTTVHNSQGLELPETGGAGTMKLITFGTLIAIAFAALLITHKKMTIYED